MSAAPTDRPPCSSGLLLGRIVIDLPAPIRPVETRIFALAIAIVSAVVLVPTVRAAEIPTPPVAAEDFAPEAVRLTHVHHHLLHLHLHFHLHLLLLAAPAVASSG